MFNLVRAYTPFTVLFFFIAGFLLHADALVAPAMPVPGVYGVAYDVALRSLVFIFGKGAFGYTLLGLLMLFGTLLFLNHVLIKHRVFLRPGYVPAFVGLLLTALLPSLAGMPGWIWTMGFTALAVGSLLDAANAQGGRRALFNAGFWGGLAALFSVPAVLLIVALFIGLAILRPIKAGEWMVMTLGFFTPVYFGAAILFLADLLPLLREWPVMGFRTPRLRSFEREGWSALGGILILAIAGGLTAARLAGRSAVSVRRMWYVLGAGCAVAVPVAILCTEGRDARGLLTALPWLLPAIAAPSAADKKTRFGTFIFYFLIALVIAVQLF